MDKKSLKVKIFLNFYETYKKLSNVADIYTTTGSTKTKFRSRTNNYKSTQRTFVNKEAVPKQALKQNRFHEHYCSYRHNGNEDWVIT